MISIIYILKTVLAMSLLLAVYRLFLEKEKMHSFNRFYLLGAVLFSFLIPLAPTGIRFTQVATPDINPDAVPILSKNFGQVLIDSPEEPVLMTIYMVVFLYFLVSSFFCLKFVRNLYQMIKMIRQNEVKGYGAAHIVLLKEDVSPFTFWNYIFLSKREYEDNKINQKLLDHELTHARQRHSWDIVFIEFVMLVFWFNPVLRWYKTAIQLNHEFLADDSVIDKYKEVKSYQYLLLDTIQNNNNKIYLASNINFHLTQKRLQMMTKKSSSLRKKILIFSILPTLLILFIGLGSPILAQNNSSEINSEVNNNSNSAKDRYFEHSIFHYKTHDGKTKIITYNSLDKDVKSKIPPPPPLPPAVPGQEQKHKEVKPLPKGTIVYLSEDGSIQIGNKRKGVMTVPPPPPPPAAPKAVMKKKGKRIALLPKPPKPPKPPKSPKPVKPVKRVKPPAPPAAPLPPPPPTTLEDLAKEGARFFIDGKEVSADEVQKLWEESSDDIKTIDVKKEKDGKKAVYVKTK